MTRDEVVERLGEAIDNEVGPGFGDLDPWEMGEWLLDWLGKQGLALVPREATDEMRRRLYDDWIFDDLIEWNDLIAAADILKEKT